MATIDELTVVLNLDADSFDTGLKKAGQGFKKAKDEAAESGKRIEESGKKASEFFGKLNIAAVALFATFAGATSVKDFIDKLTNAEVASGRLAKALDMPIEKLSLWEGLMVRMNGTTADADTAFSHLKDTWFDINVMMNGNNPAIGILNRLGINVAELKNGEELLLKLADAFQKMHDPAQATYLGHQLGLTDPMIQELMKGRAAVEKDLQDQRKIGFITPEEAKAASEFKSSMSEIKQLAEDLGRDFLVGINPEVKTFADRMVALAGNDSVKEFFKNFGRLTGATINAATNPKPVKGMGIGSYPLGVALEIVERITGVKLDATGGDGSKPVGQASPSAPRLDGGHHRTRGLPLGDSSTPQGRAALIEAALMAAGYSESAANGVVGGMGAETAGTYSPTIKNPTSTAYGLGQWTRSSGRWAEFQKRFHKDIHQSTFDEQVQFLIWEMAHSYAGAGSAIRGAKSDTEAMRAYIEQVMRPGSTGVAVDMRYGAGYLNSIKRAARVAPASTATGAPQVNFSGPITITTNATDAHGMAREAVPALTRQFIFPAWKGMF